MTAIQLQQIGFTDYRCFHSEQVLDLKPLTLLYGKNNAGKSTALRALAILSRSVASNAASAWDVGGSAGPGRGAGFRAFPWREKSTKFFTLRLVWSVDDTKVEDLLELEQEGRFDPVRVRSVHPGDGPLWKFHPTDDDRILYDRHESGGIPETGENTRTVEFQYHHDRSTMGNLAEQCSPSVLLPDGTQTAESVVRNFDDGWRVESTEW